MSIRSGLRYGVNPNGECRAEVNGIGCAFWGGRGEGDDYTFASPRREGEPISGLRESFNRAKKRAGIDDPSVTPHILRHSVASGLAAEGVPPQVIGKVLGQRHSKTTEIYAHLTADAVPDAADKFAKRVGCGEDGS